MSDAEVIARVIELLDDDGMPDAMHWTCSENTGGQRSTCEDTDKSRS